MSNRTVSAISIRDGKFFLAKKNPGGSIGDLWEFPGGRIEDEETHGEALKRELMKKFSVEIEVGKRIATAWYENKGKRYRVDGYESEFLTDDKEIKVIEHSEWGWFSMDEINKMHLAGSDRNLFVKIELEMQGK